MGKRQELEVQSHDRMMQALELRKLGLAYSEIAKRLKYSDASGAHKAVKRAIDRTLTDSAEEVKQLELKRLDNMLRQVLQDAYRGDTKAILAVLRIMERRAKMLGLDAPVQVDVDARATLVDRMRMFVEEHGGEVEVEAKVVEEGTE